MMARSHSRLRCVFEGDHLVVWLESAGETSTGLTYQVWDGLAKWLPRIVPRLAKEVREGCVEFTWSVRMDAFNPERSIEPDMAATAETVSTLIDFEVDVAGRKVSMFLPATFLDNFYHPHNIAERAILGLLIEAVSRLLGRAIDKNEVLSQVMHTDKAREIHLFMATTFIDYVQDSLPNAPITINDLDDAASRTGIAWMDQQPEPPKTIHGKTECVSELHDAVDRIWTRIRDELRDLDRVSTMGILCINIEAIRSKESHWAKSVPAIFALHENRDDTELTIKRMRQLFTGSATASRFLLEMALCECPLTGGREPARFDVSRMLTLVALMNEIAGWSDAISVGVMPPHIHTTATGIYLVDATFQTDVVDAFGTDFLRSEFSQAARRYELLFQATRGEGTEEKPLDAGFEDAWSQEYGFTIRQAIEFVIAIEDLGIEQRHAVLKLSREHLEEIARSLSEASSAEAMVREFTLVTRKQWNAENLAPQEYAPWRFRRKLSRVYRPILQVDESAGSLCLVAPAALQESLAYRVNAAFEANFPAEFFRSRCSVSSVIPLSRARG